MENPIPMVIAPTSIEFAAVKRSIMPFLREGVVSLAQCGMGENLAHAFGEKLDCRKVSCLVLLGWAGGLIPELKAGDFVCANSAVYFAREPINCKLVPIPSAHTGPILTVSKALLSSEEKLQAQSAGALAVEMEAYPLALKAAQMGIPFIHARIILDTLDESIPEFSTNSGENGEIKLLPFLKNLLKKPVLIKSLWQMNIKIRALNPLLGRLASEVCEAVLKESSNRLLDS